jgi:hypothetical protein
MTRRRAWPRIHVAVFAAALTAWTVALLSPVPHESAKEVLGSDRTLFLFAKGLHVGVYAVLAILGGSVAAFGRKWVWVLPALVAHGGVTEFIQQYVPGRTGRIEDVGIDSIGIAAGGLVVWAYRSFTGPRAAGPSTRE